MADQVTWVHSYVSTDKKKTFCVYDAPSPEAIRRTAQPQHAARWNPLPRFASLDPYFYK